MSNEQSNDMEVKEAKSGAQSSRFDRRRFLRTSAAATPLMLTVTSPLSWAGGNSGGKGGKGGKDKGGKCSLSVMMSGNASHPHGWCQSEAKSPGYWHKVFDETNNGVGGQEKINIRDVIESSNYTETTNFNEVFLWSQLLTGIYRTRDGQEWKIQLDDSTDSPSFGDTLPEGSSRFSLVVNFSKVGDPSASYTVDLTNGKNNVQKFAVAALFNSLFSPNLIDYSYEDPSEVIAAFKEKTREIMQSVFSKLRNGQTRNLISGHPYEDLLENFNQWD